jgi:sugar lactone lactonase YvrE
MGTDTIGQYVIFFVFLYFCRVKTNNTNLSAYQNIAEPIYLFTIFSLNDISHRTMSNVIKHFICLIGIFLIYGCDNFSYHKENFDQPTHAIFGKDGYLYVSDGYFNSRIVVLNNRGEYIREWGAKGYAKGQFNNPHGIGFLQNGNLLVCDRDNARIQVFSPDGKFLHQWYSKSIGRPWNLCVSSKNDIYIVDGGDQDGNNPRAGIVKLDSNGTFIARYSNFGTLPGELNWPHSIGIDTSNNIFVVDLRNQRVQRFSQDTQLQLIPDTTWLRTSSPHYSKPLSLTVHNQEVYISQDIVDSPIVVFDATTGQKKERNSAGYI